MMRFFRMFCLLIGSVFFIWGAIELWNARPLPMHNVLDEILVGLTADQFKHDRRWAWTHFLTGCFFLFIAWIGRKPGSSRLG